MNNQQPYKRITLQIFALALCCSFASAVNAGEIYKWVDENGKVHYSDKKPPKHTAEQINVEVKNTYESVDYPKSPNVTMFATSWCGYCKQARKYFRKNNIAFTEYDIEKNASAKREYDRLGGSSVPLILVGDKQIKGFSERRFVKVYEGVLKRRKSDD